MNYNNILHDVARDIDLNEVEINYFKSLLTPKVFKRKQFVLRGGRIANHTYFANKGCLRVYRVNKYGKIHIAHFAIENH